MCDPITLLKTASSIVGGMNALKRPPKPEMPAAPVDEVQVKDADVSLGGERADDIDPVTGKTRARASARSTGSTLRTTKSTGISIL